MTEGHPDGVAAVNGQITVDGPASVRTSALVAFRCVEDGTPRVCLLAQSEDWPEDT